MSGRLGTHNSQLSAGMPYKPMNAIRNLNSVGLSHGLQPGSMLGLGPAAPASVVGNLLAQVWGGNDDKTEYDYLTNWHDIHGRHNGRTIVAESRRLTEEAINARGNFFLAAVAPVLLTNEMYVTISRSEPYIMPLDNIPMMGTPFESNRVAVQQSYGLMSYKGAESISSEFLRDVHYGKESLAELSYVLSRRMMVTLVDNVALACVDVPWMASVNMFKTLRNGGFAGHYIDAESFTFVGVNKDPKKMLHKIISKRTMRRPIDRIIVPEGKAHVFADALTSPKNMAYYMLAYDDATGKVIQMMFDNGEPSLGTIAVGGNGDMAVIEAPTQVSSSFDEPEQGVQRLHTYPVVGDLIQEQWGLTVEQATGSIDDVDVRTWSQSMTEITHPAMRHSAGLKYCAVFNDFGKEGGAPAAQHRDALTDDDFGDKYKKLVASYTSQPAKTYLSQPFDGLLDNNTPPVGSSSKKTHAQMDDWRQYYPIVGVYGRDGAVRIGTPKRLGDISLRGLSPYTLLDAVRKLKRATYGIAELKTKLVFATQFAGQHNATFGQTHENAMDIDGPVAESTFEQDRTALARVKTQHDLASALGKLARGPGSFVEHARHIPDSHVDAFIGFYKGALDQLHGLAGQEQLTAASENFKQRLSELQTLRGQALLLQAVNRASDKMSSANPSLATWNDRLFKNSEISGKSAPLKGATFKLEAALKQQPMQKPASHLGVPNSTLGAILDDRGKQAIYDAHADNLGMANHLIAVESFNLTGDARGNTDRGLYQHLLDLPFSYYALKGLYENFGISLFNVNRYRNRQYYENGALSGYISDRSYITMFTHPQARSGIDAIHGMVTETIEFRSAVIPLEPESTFIFPYAFANRLISEVNCRPARSFNEATSTEPDAPSCICTLVPKDEYVYDMPFSFTGNDIHENKPMSKHSDTDLIRMMFSEQWLNHSGTLSANPIVYDKNGTFSDIIHRAWTEVFNPKTSKHEPRNGTGPRAETFVNCSEAHEIWTGNAPRFPVQLDVCTFVRIEINVA